VALRPLLRFLSSTSSDTTLQCGKPVIISSLSSPQESFTAVVPRVESVDRFFVALAGHKGKSADFSSRLGFVGASSHAVGLTGEQVLRAPAPPIGVRHTSALRGAERPLLHSWVCSTYLPWLTTVQSPDGARVDPADV